MEETILPRVILLVTKELAERVGNGRSKTHDYEGVMEREALKSIWLNFTRTNIDMGKWMSRIVKKEKDIIEFGEAAATQMRRSQFARQNASQRNNFNYVTQLSWLGSKRDEFILLNHVAVLHQLCKTGGEITSYEGLRSCFFHFTLLESFNAMVKDLVAEARHDIKKFYGGFFAGFDGTMVQNNHLNSIVAARIEQGVGKVVFVLNHSCVQIYFTN